MDNSNKIPNKIANLKKELNDCYQLFITARDSLDSIEFTGLEKHFHQQIDIDQHLDKIVHNKTIDDCLFNMDDEIKKTLITDLPTKIDSIPEIKAFFRVFNNLKDGMRKMDVNSQRFTELDKEIEDEVIQINETTKGLKISLSKMDSTLVKQETDKYDSSPKYK